MIRLYYYYSVWNDDAGTLCTLGRGGERLGHGSWAWETARHANTVTLVGLVMAGLYFISLCIVCAAEGAAVGGAARLAVPVQISDLKHLQQLYRSSFSTLWPGWRKICCGLE